jgi:WD40 repeat protein
LASGSEDSTIKLWRVESHKQVTTLQCHDNIVRSIAFSPDGKYLASGSEDNTVKLWRMENFQEI